MTNTELKELHCVGCGILLSIPAILISLGILFTCLSGCGGVKKQATIAQKHLIMSVDKMGKDSEGYIRPDSLIVTNDQRVWLIDGAAVYPNTVALGDTVTYLKIWRSNDGDFYVVVHGNPVFFMKTGSRFSDTTRVTELLFSDEELALLRKQPR